MQTLIKSTLRRAHDPAFLQHYFSGVGLDIGVDASSSLAPHVNLFPRVARVVPWQGDVASVPGVEEKSFDFVHASHCLQRVPNPGKTLARWLDLVKPGGYLVLTVPDEHLDGTCAPECRWRFTICETKPALPAPVNVLDMVRSVAAMGACERITRVRDHHVEGAAANSSAALAERAIEVVLRKRQAPAPQECMAIAAQAQTAGECLRACQEAVQTYPYRFNIAHLATMCMLRWNLVDEIGSLWDDTVERLHDEWNPKLYQFLHVIASGKIHAGFQLRTTAVKNWPWQRRTTAQPPTQFPAWTGQPLAGKSIVIWSEFGLGDEIFFLRFARMLRQQGAAASVTVVCQTPLAALFEVSGQADAVVPVDQVASLPPHDYWVYPHDIPAYLPVELEALPDAVPYLFVAPDAPAFELPGRGGALKVGIAFKGAPTHENDKARSLPSLSVLDPLFEHREVEFYSLQKGAGEDEAAAYAQRLANFHDVGAAMQTMMETARVIHAMDLVLTVDTSVAHVAAAMGKPTWLLLPAFADWRWHYVREDSPWYPSMKLFRHQFSGDWAEVIARVNGHLLGWIDARSAPMKLE